MPTLAETVSPHTYLKFAPAGQEAVLTAAISDFSGLIQETKLVPTVYELFSSKQGISWSVMSPDPRSPKGWSYHTYSPDVRTHLAQDPTLSPAQKIYQLVSDPKNFTPHPLTPEPTCFYYWCSPRQPEKYTEYQKTIVEIGLISQKPDGSFSGKVISNIAPEWSQADCAFWHAVLSRDLSDVTPDQIRSSPLILHPPDTQDPLTWFSNNIGKPELSRQYHSGYLEENQAETLQQITYEASMFSVAVMSLFNQGRTDYQPEKLVSRLRSAAGGQIVSACLSETGTATSTSEKHFVRNCGNCGLAINTWIPKGYRCSKCNGIYEGC